MEGLVARLRYSGAMAPALCGLFATLGCSHFGQTQSAAPALPKQVAEAEEESNLIYDMLHIQPKRTPTPELCVGLAEIRLQTASKPDLPPVAVQRLHDEARRAYQQAIKLDKKHLPAYLGLAKLYQIQGDTNKAVETYEQGLKFLPKEAGLWYELGMCQARRKTWDPALNALKKASEFDPENPVYLNALGFSLARAGRFDDSFACFQKSVGEAKAHYNVARALHHVNRDEESKQHLRQALMAKPNLEPAQQLLAQLENPNRNATSIQQAGYMNVETDPSR